MDDFSMKQGETLIRYNDKMLYVLQGGRTLNRLQLPFYNRLKFSVGLSEI